MLNQPPCFLRLASLEGVVDDKSPGSYTVHARAIRTASAMSKRDTGNRNRRIREPERRQELSRQFKIRRWGSCVKQSRKNTYPQRFLLDTPSGDKTVIRVYENSLAPQRLCVGCLTCLVGQAPVTRLIPVWLRTRPIVWLPFRFPRVICRQVRPPLASWLASFSCRCRMRHGAPFWLRIVFMEE